jgi:hypothetical protein
MSAAAALALVASLVVAAPAAAAETTYSGDIAAAGPHAVTLAVMGPWTPGSRPVDHVITLASSTRVERVARSATAPGWPGGFETTPLTVGDLHKGEFATVTAQRQGRRLVARTVTVVETR